MVTEVIAYLIDVPDELVPQLMEEDLIRNCPKHGYEVAGGRESYELEERIEQLEQQVAPDKAT